MVGTRVGEDSGSNVGLCVGTMACVGGSCVGGNVVGGNGVGGGNVGEGMIVGINVGWLVGITGTVTGGAPAEASVAVAAGISAVDGFCGGRNCVQHKRMMSMTLNHRAF